MQDLLAHLRPALERLTSFEQAAQAVASIEISEARSVAAGPAGLGAIEEEDSDSDDSADNSGSNSDNEGTVHSRQCTETVASALSEDQQQTSQLGMCVNARHPLRDGIHLLHPSLGAEHLTLNAMLSRKSRNVCICAGRGGRGAADEDDGSNAAVTDQDDDDDHVKLLNPVKVLGTQAARLITPQPLPCQS